MTKSGRFRTARWTLACVFLTALGLAFAIAANSPAVREWWCLRALEGSDREEDREEARELYRELAEIGGKRTLSHLFDEIAAERAQQRKKRDIEPDPDSFGSTTPHESYDGEFVELEGHMVLFVRGDYTLVYTLWQVASRLGRDAAPELLARASSSEGYVRYLVVMLCRGLEADAWEVVPAFRELASDELVAVREEVGPALWRVGRFDVSTLPVVRVLLTSSDADERGWGLELAGRFDSQNLSDLRAELEDTVTFDSEYIRNWARELLTKLDAGG